jgi:hypothetical protein
MTWNTRAGKRILRGAEAKLFADAICCMIELMRDSKECSKPSPRVMFDSYNAGGEGTFKTLDDDAKFSVLEVTATALLMETATCPELTHINESCINYVFSFLRQSVQLYSKDETLEESPFALDILKTYNECFLPPIVTEKDTGRPSRSKIAKRKRDEEEDEEEREELRSACPVAGSSCDMWEEAITRLEERILWDDDYEYPPQIALEEELCTDLGIEEGYYSLRKQDVVVSLGAMERVYKLCGAMS